MIPMMTLVTGAWFILLMACSSDDQMMSVPDASHRLREAGVAIMRLPAQRDHVVFTTYKNYRTGDQRLTVDTTCPYPCVTMELSPYGDTTSKPMRLTLGPQGIVCGVADIKAKGQCPDPPLNTSYCRFYYTIDTKIARVVEVARFSYNRNEGSPGCNQYSTAGKIASEEMIVFGP